MERQTTSKRANQHVPLPSTCLIAILASSYLLSMSTCRAYVIDTTNNQNGNKIVSASNRVAYEEQYGFRRLKWANTAWDFVRKADCNSAFFAAPDACRSVRGVDRQNVGIYLAAGDNTTTSSGAVKGSEVKFIPSLPDGLLVAWNGNKWSSDAVDVKADAVLVLDPYLDASFGHLVVVFLIHTRVTESWCSGRRGLFLGEHGDCLLNAVSDCPSAATSSPDSVSCSSPETMSVEFLPLTVADDGRPRSQENQALICRSGISGFAQCRETTASSGNSSNGPFTLNHRLRCATDGDQGCFQAVKAASPRCRLFETCDHAVAISGGWNRQTATAQGLKSLRQFYKMLRRNGFSKTNVKTFFEDSFDASQSEFTEFGGQNAVYPAASKSAIRGYIQSVCRSPGCADSLVIYLSNPTLPDGTSLLWDADGDGKVSDEERYTVDELVDDLSDCSANRVVVIADQSHSGKIVSAVAKAYQTLSTRPGASSSPISKVANVVVMASGGEDDYSWGGEFTRSWAYAKHQQSCLADVQEQATSAIRNSQPSSFDEGRIAKGNTIFGAPCNVFSPFTYRELRTNYLGCQTVPTRVWLEMHAPSRRQKQQQTDPRGT